ncbi:unnamed protein product [Rhizophagus irregularis]|nr:unnamed protein product [Rhizophagus irregularis]
MIFTIISLFVNYSVFSLLIVITVIYVTQYYYRYFTRPNPLPGPFPLPILGNAHQRIGFEHIDWLMSLYKKYGDMYEINLAGERVIILSRPDLIENMNVPSSKTKYPIRNLITEGSMEYMKYGASGSGISRNTDYKSWKYNRQFVSQAMMTPNFNDKIITRTIELWREMESYWNIIGENKELDLKKWMSRFTNEIIFEVSTGVKNNSVASYYSTLIPENYASLNKKEKEKIEETEKFIQSLEIFDKGLIYFFMFNKLIRRYVPFIRGQINNFLKNRDYLFDKIYNIIKERRVEIENTPLDQPLRYDMLTSYLTANTPRDINVTKHADIELLRPMTDSDVFDNIFDSLLGGGTMSNLICFVIYYLGTYPEVKQRLRQEIEMVLGKDLTKPITAKDLDELQYCDAVIKEVHRHHPISFSIPRVNLEKDEVGGINWPEKTSFQMHYGAIMKNKNYWTDPEKFDPDRFYKVEESDKYLLEKQHIKDSFTIWGGGIRICPGRKLAMIVLKCLVSLIYRKYDIVIADVNEPFKCRSGLLRVCKELIVKIKPRIY